MGANMAPGEVRAVKSEARADEKHAWEKDDRARADEKHAWEKEDRARANEDARGASRVIEARPFVTRFLSTFRAHSWDNQIHVVLPKSRDCLHSDVLENTQAFS